MLVRFLVALALVLLVVGCSSLEKSAAKDPLKCERDPNCQHRNEKSRDCATQCSDDYECMKRCQMVQSGIDRPP